jgi:DNA (cytosine-5)-methyltransferase 1
MNLGIDAQEQLLYQAVNSGTKLSDILSLNGFTYEDLRYSDSFGIKHHTKGTKFPTIDSITPSTEGIPAVSFFSGAGGLDVGFKYAGFKNIISIEHTELFCNTLRLNNPDKTVIGPPEYQGDISKKDEIANILRNLGINEYFNGVFHGGPPCQSFSIAANQRFNKSGDNFKRTGFADQEKGMLLFDYIWFIKTFKPLAFLIENVGGITEFDDNELIDSALDDLRKIGYIIDTPQILDAAYYDVPQRRKRWIVLGTRGSKAISYPQPSATEMPCGPIFEKSIDNVPNHITRMHKAESVLRYMMLAPGQRDHLGRVDRLDPLKPSKTVIAGGVKGGGRSHLHPYIPRTISVRECARLQTFPDSYIFTGTTARQFTQVGNAVPPMFAYKLAVQMKEAIIDDWKKHR